MRLGAIGENPVERILTLTNLAPVPLIETQIAFSMARAIMAGVKVGLYDAIASGARTAVEVAAACRTDRVATTKLLDTLVGCRYLTHRDGRYRLTGKASKWMVSTSPHSIADKLLFQYDEWDIVTKYEDYLATGEPLEVHGTIEGGALWDRYQRGMRAVSGISAPEVAARLPVPVGATDMLDIGGSHGFYSVCLCRRHGGLRSTILDLPEAIEHAAPILAAEGLGERVRHRAGNALTDDLGASAWDVVFLSQLVHHFTDEQNRELMRRIRQALRPNGVCVLLDVIRPESPGAAGGVGAVLDLYFAATSRSGTWPIATMQSWHRDAGLVVEKPIPLRTMPNAAMVVGRKPCA